MIKKLKVFEVTPEKNNKIKIYDTEEFYFIYIKTDQDFITLKKELLDFIFKYLKKHYNLKIEGYIETGKGFNLYTKNFEIKL